MDAKIEPPQMDLKVEDKKIEISIERSPKAMHSKDLSNLNQITSPKLSTNLSVTTSPTKSVKKKKSAALMDDFFALAPKKKKKTKRKVLESNEEISNNDVSLLTSSVVSVTQAAPLLQSLPSPNDIVSSTLDKHAETEKVGPNSEEVNKVSSPLAGEPIAEYQEILVGVTDEEVEDDFKIDPTPFDDLSDNESGYIFNEENEGKRSYQLLVKPVVSTISKKVPMDDFFVKTNGNVKFTEIFNNEILPQINQVTKNAFSSPNELALIWVEGKTEIKYFFKPSTLRIEPKNMELFSFDGTEEQECTKLTILVIPSQDVKTFSALYPEYFRDKKAEATNYLIEEARREKEKAISTSDIELSEGEDDNVDLSKPVGQRIGGLPKAVIDKVGGNEETDQYFVIGLKGKDNKRLEVKVCSNTSMNQLLDYFLLKKSIIKLMWIRAKLSLYLMMK